MCRRSLRTEGSKSRYGEHVGTESSECDRRSAPPVEVNVDLSNYSQAEEIEHRVLLILDKSLGQDHAQISAVVSDLGRIYLYQDRYTEAELLYRRSLSIEIKEKTGGEDDNDNGHDLEQPRGDIPQTEPHDSGGTFHPLTTCKFSMTLHRQDIFMS